MAVGMIDRERRHPVAETDIAFQPRIELHAVLILARVGRIDIGVQREARRQHAVLDRMRAVRILTQRCHVDIEMELAQISVAGSTIQNMTAIHAGTILAELLRRGIRAERLLEYAPIRQIAADRGHAGAARTRADRYARGRGPRRIVNDLDDADERGRAVHDRRRAAQHFDALDIGQIQRRQCRVEGTARRDAIDNKQEGIELAQAP